MKTILFGEYQKSLLKKEGSHIYVEQDFAYDENGKKYLTNVHKVTIINNGKYQDNFEVLFGDFKECKTNALNRCSKLELSPTFIVHDLHKYNNKDKDFELNIISL